MDGPEIAVTCGLLDPAHSQTPEIIEQVTASHRPSAKVVPPNVATAPAVKDMEFDREP